MTLTSADYPPLTENDLDEHPERAAVRSGCGLLAEKGPDGRWYTPPGHVLGVRTLLAGGVRVLDRGGGDRRIVTKRDEYG